MEKAGLVRRRRNPDDARSVIVEPTAKGNAVWGKAVNEQGRWESAAVGGALTETEQKQLNKLLRKLLAGLSKPED
jgi:DNA-binding MarR family transcriptional regulator